MKPIKLKSVILFKHIRLADNEQIDRLDIDSVDPRRKVEELWLVPNVGIVGKRKHKKKGEIFQFIFGVMLIQSSIPLEVIDVDIKDKSCQDVKTDKKAQKTTKPR